MRVKLFILFFLYGINLSAQTNKFQYKRTLTGVNTTWHNIVLPDEMYKYASSGFSDLRIFGSKGTDSLEVPYLLKQNADKVLDRSIDFKLINPSHNNLGYFYTFETPGKDAINEINLTFDQNNFDWKVDLEGSNDNANWFTILTNYRILAIKNNNTDYSFSKLNFQKSKYLYYRILIKSSEQPKLTASKILKTDTLKGNYKAINVFDFELKNDNRNKETVINISLKTPLPVSYLRLNTKVNFDFYRSLKIESVTDSFKTEGGMQYNYAELYNGTISSLELPIYNFQNTITDKLKITIQNNDNPPLNINSLELKGNPFEIIARFDHLDYNYALYYGNTVAQAPNYEISKFEDKIANNLIPLQIGKAEKNPAFTIKIDKPLFENKIWLWVLMAGIIVILGFFSFRMLKN